MKGPSDEQIAKLRHKCASNVIKKLSDDTYGFTQDELIHALEDLGIDYENITYRIPKWKFWIYREE